MKVDEMKYGGELDRIECFGILFYFIVGNGIYCGGLEEVEELVFCFYVIIYGGGLDAKECFGILFYCGE